MSARKLGFWQQKLMDEPMRMQFHRRESSVPGTWTIEATVPEMPFPVASVQFGFRGANSAVEVFHSYVIPAYRRLGIRTAIHIFMMAQFPQCSFLTGSATRQSRPWLAKMGFVEQESGDWILTRKKVSKRR